MSQSTDIVPAGPRASAIASMGDLERGAKAVAASGLFGMKTVDQALVLMLLCQSEGKDPIQAVRQYHIINGRPSMRADAMQAEFQARGGAVEFHERTEEACDASFVWGQTRARIRWTMADAKKAGLTAKPGPWQQFPRAMLHARCVSEGVRAVMPGVVAGIYTPEEVAAFEPLIVEEVASPPEVMPTPAKVIESTPPAPTGQRAPQPPKAPVDTPTPTDAPVKAAKHAFAAAARTAGHDVMTDGNWDSSKVYIVLSEILKEGHGPANTSLQDWKLGLESMPAYVAANAAAAPTAEASDTPDDDDDDPFAEKAPAGAAIR